jgi:hypothetical protein
MSAIDTTLSPGTGFHPTFTTFVHGRDKPAASECTFHVVLDLPPSLIVDRFQLDELNRDRRLFVLSGSRKEEENPLSEDPNVSLHVRAERDLEKPVQAIIQVDPEPSTVLVSVSGWSGVQPAVVSVPVQLRYQEPVSNAEIGKQQRRKDATVDITVSEPVAFWSCPKGSG